MTDNHVSAGPMVEIHDADFEAIRKELHDGNSSIASVSACSRQACRSSRTDRSFIWPSVRNAMNESIFVRKSRMWISIVSIGRRMNDANS